MKTTNIILGTLVAMVGQVAMADSTGGSQSLQLRAQTFGGTETTYRSYSYKAANEDGSAFHLKAVQSDRTIGTVTTGGNDFEFGFSSQVGGTGATYSLGFAFPSTTADSSTSFVYGYSRALTDSINLSFKGYSGATSANALFLTKTFTIFGANDLSVELGGIVSGYSTVDETTGAPKRNILVNARLSHQLFDGVDGFIGVTNTLGDTTRFSLNSSVGNKYAFTFGIAGKF